MSSATAGALGRAPHGLLDKATILAKPGFNRWLVPPAALAIRTAEAAGITLAGITRSDGFELFTHPRRIAREAADAAG